ncbi:MAG: 30S ribosomal protein S8 [Candidatus Micrarchaeia archaeon]
MDILADALNVIKNYKRFGKNSCIVKPTSKLLIELLRILKENNYITSFEVIEDGRGNKVKIDGINAINECRVIKPRFAVAADEWIKWEQRYILSKDFGIIIVSTSQGLMTNREARSRNIGGRLIAYVY